MLTSEWLNTLLIAICAYLFVREFNRRDKTAKDKKARITEPAE